MAMSPARAIAFAYTAASLAPSLAAAQPPGARVIATRDEVRVVFPADTSRDWEQPGTGSGIYLWSFTVATVAGTRSVSLRIDRTGSTRRTVPSLAALVASDHPLLCPPGPFVSCAGQGLSASVHEGRVTLRVRGRRLVQQLFVLRPEFVDVRFLAPSMNDDVRDDRVRVDYRDPQLPRPDAAEIAAVERARRNEVAGARSFSRFIASEEPGYGALWMSVGDSIALRVEEERCNYDACSIGFSSLADSSWTAMDTSVIRLRPVTRDSASRRRGGQARQRVIAVALRTGRTTVRVHGVHGESDTIPARSHGATEVEREVVVTRRPARIEITPHIDTVRLGETRPFRVHVYDEDGRELTDAPAELLLTSPGEPVRYGGGSRPITFERAGTAELVASFAGLTDRLSITVRRAPP